jgi:hypothetical protein
VSTTAIAAVPTATTTPAATSCLSLVDIVYALYSGPGLRRHVVFTAR